MHVVSDFVRFSLFPDNRLPYPVAVIRKQDNVVRSLDRNDAELWKDLKHNTRKKISSARRLGVHVLQDPTGERLADFARIYEHTMERRQAAPSYRFARAYFEQLRQTLQGKFRFFHAIHDGRVISTELVLVSRRIVYSFLGGTDAGSFDLKPNPLLKYEIFRWAKDAGKRYAVLGGCPENLPGILTYKLSFAPSGRLPYYVGQRVLLSDRHYQLIAARAACDSTWMPRPGFFPHYRA
jgi:lipid II:glycine glycyltransferase (peptidoglycan interpeptide bridge formation enzyme)